MAAEHWFRWHHGTVNDPKWRVVAARASSSMSRNVTVGHVLSVWAAMLECASQANPRGSLVGWDSEDVAAGLGIDQAEVSAIVDAMQGKTIEGEELTGWKRRQPKAEDGTAAGRKRAQREREKASNPVVTAGDDGGCHGMSRNVTTETETETEEKEAASLRSASSSAAPDDLLGNAASQTDSGKGDLAERLARVTDEAIAAYNASPLVKSNGGHLPNVSPKVGREKRQGQVKRCLRVARSICEEGTGSPRVTAEFWRDYFAAVALDDFYAGRQSGGAGHENFVPDFELLTREQTMLRIYDRTGAEAAA